MLTTRTSLAAGDGPASDARAWPRPVLAAAIATLSLSFLPDPAMAQARVADLLPHNGLQDLTIEQLAQVEVTSVAKRPEALSEAPAAVYVITREDIRRSGATTLPEALRLAPNLQVVEVNTFTWSISARGFNTPEAANKLLVLIDGRSVYSPLDATVFWETANVLLQDIERIEVVSGPGGALWGANAVNGVINIITRDSHDTQGPMIQAVAGSRDLDLDLRYGGRLGENGAFRVYAMGFDRRDTLATGSADTTKDAVKGAQGGFRFDDTAGRDSYTLQGDAYGSHAPDRADSATGGNLLGRWTHDMGPGSSLQVQAYYDTSRRTQVSASQPLFREELQTYDIQAQDNFAATDRHQLVIGGEARAWREELTSGNIFRFAQPQRVLYLGNAFIQDEIALRDDLKLTLGLKAEDNSYSGLDWLPNVRLAWKLGPDHLLWGAVSRAVRTPSRIDRELEASGFLAPAPDFRPETVTAYELGFRAQPLSSLSFSISAYYNVYDDLRSDQLTAGGLPIMLVNGLRADTYGFEAWGDYRPASWWRLSAGFSNLHKHVEQKPGILDISALQSVGEDPAYQAFLRSRMNLSGKLTLDADLRAIDHVDHPLFGSVVPAYAEANARLGWRVSDQVELSVAGLNLLHDRHIEADDSSATPVREIGRSVYVSLRWGF